MTDTQELRRLAEIAQQSTGSLVTSPREILSLLDRLEKAEKDAERLHELLILQHAESVELFNALSDLSFECFDVFSTKPPSREIYNKTFAVFNSKRHLSPAALSGSNGNSAAMEASK